MKTLIARHEIPGTGRTVSLYRDISTRRGCIVYAGYVVEREDGARFNYLSCGAKTLREARKVANFLWADARARTAAAR